MKIGILGGTFDPIHNGHLAIAEEARAYLNLTRSTFSAGRSALDEIRQADFAGAAPHGDVRPGAAGQTLHFKLSTIEIEHQGPSYSVDTIAKLKAQSAEATDLYFIIGWDNLAKIPRWKEPQN